MGATIVAVGRLARAPEMQYTPKGTALTHFNMGVKTGYSDKESTVWFAVSVFGAQAEACQKFLDKGSRIKVVGEFSEVKTYDKKDGSTGIDLRLKAMDVEFLDGAKSKQDSNTEPEDF